MYSRKIVSAVKKSQAGRPSARMREEASGRMPR
jgi:hypothetical protein